MVMTTSKMRKSTKPNNDVKLITPTEEIRPSPSEKLLGARIHQDMKWEEHLQDNKESAIKSLSTRLGALKMIGRVGSFKTRKMVGNGIFMSKLTYLIGLWGGCNMHLLKSLQIMQNKAARVVTKLDWSTSTSVLLAQYCWLSVKKLLVYHSVVLVYKVLKSKQPKPLHSMFPTEYTYKKTSTARSMSIQQRGHPTLDIGKDSFRWRAAKSYNQLPVSIKSCESLEQFKLEAKKWTNINIQVHCS